MKCLLYECNEQTPTDKPWLKFCSGTHAYWFEQRKNDLDLCFQATFCRKEQEQYDELHEKEPQTNWNKPYRMNRNIEEVELLYALSRPI